MDKLFVVYANEGQSNPPETREGQPQDPIGIHFNEDLIKSQMQTGPGRRLGGLCHEYYSADGTVTIIKYPDSPRTIIQITPPVTDLEEKPEGLQVPIEAAYSIRIDIQEDKRIGYNAELISNDPKTKRRTRTGQIYQGPAYILDNPRIPIPGMVSMYTYDTADKSNAKEQLTHEEFIERLQLILDQVEQSFLPPLGN